MMKRNFLSKLFQASLMCCLAVILTGCEELFNAIDNPIQTSISMYTSDVKLGVGEQKQRQATCASPATVVYASANPAIATVDANGVVTGVAAGTTTITASVAAVDGWTAASASYKVIVGDGSSSSATPNPGASTPADMKSTPLTFEAAVAGAVVTFKAGHASIAKDIKYSVNGGALQSGNTGGSGVSVTLEKVGDKVSFYGDNAAYGAAIGTPIPSFYGNNIECTENCYIYGNIMSLIKADGFENETAFTTDNVFCSLFKGNTHILNHTDGAKQLILPATKMTEHCYWCMFDGCTGLTTTPVLDVDCNGAEFALENMFEDCTNLAAVGEGSKISGNMGENALAGMFSGCSKLALVPADFLPSTSLADLCYTGMFDGCSSLTTAPKLPATTLAGYCYYSMFCNCTSLSAAWVKADYSVANFECSSMFYGCANIGTLHTDGTGWAAGTNLPTGWTTTTYE